MTLLRMLFVCSLLAAAQDTLNNDSIVKMVQAGLGDGVIVSIIQSQPGKYSLTPDDLVNLKQSGASDKVLAAMVGKGSATAAAPAAAPAPSSASAAAAVKGIVLAGAGSSPKHIQDVLDGLKDRFAEAGVNVTLVEKSRTDILDQIKVSGGSLLWITVDIAAGQLKDKVRAQFFDSSGTKVWDEEATGGTFNFSSSGAINNMVKNIYKKIEAHLKGK